MVPDYSGLTVHNGASAHSKGTCDWCPLSRKTGKLIELTSLVCQSVVSHVPATGAPYLENLVDPSRFKVLLGRPSVCPSVRTDVYPIDWNLPQSVLCALLTIKLTLVSKILDTIFFVLSK